jgi:hypothetical protein
MSKIKKLHLPPTTLEGIETYLRNRGYRLKPTLQDVVPNAVLTFDKPLPDGRRIHGFVLKGKEKFYVKQHIDDADPYRDPIGHFFQDIGVKHKTSISTVKKRRKTRKGKKKE